MITSCNFGLVNVSSLVIIRNIKVIYVLITHWVEFIFLGMLCSMNSFSLSNIQSLSPYTSCLSSLITILIFSHLLLIFPLPSQTLHLLPRLLFLPYLPSLRSLYLYHILIHLLQPPLFLYHHNLLPLPTPW